MSFSPSASASDCLQTFVLQLVLLPDHVQSEPRLQRLALLSSPNILVLRAALSADLDGYEVAPLRVVERNLTSRRKAG
jgi:hypothetical protein